MRFIAWIFNLTLAGIAAAFAFANRQDIEIGLWPLTIKIVLPVYVLAFAACVLGIFFGLVMAWIGRMRSKRKHVAVS